MEKIQPGCTADAKGNCARCSIHKEMGEPYCDNEILMHMGEAGCIIAKEAAEQSFYEAERAEVEAEEEMAEAYENEFGDDGGWESDDDDQDYHDDYFSGVED